MKWKSDELLEDIWIVRIDGDGMDYYFIGEDAKTFAFGFTLAWSIKYSSGYFFVK